MASLPELVALFNNGELGKLIANTFHGERGFVYANEDSDLLVVFSSEKATPSPQLLKQLIKDHYSKLGYVVEFTAGSIDGDLFGVEFRISGDVVVVVTITTRYPNNDHCRNVRITSIILA